MTNALVSTDPVLSSSNGLFVKGKLKVLPGRFELTPSRIIYYQKSRFWMAFGLIGALVLRGQKGTRAMEIQLHQITSIERTRYGFNKNILDVTLADGTKHRIGIEKFDQFSEQLRAAHARRATA